jgi:hypothetical protein
MGTETDTSKLKTESALLISGNSGYWLTKADGYGITGTYWQSLKSTWGSRLFS